MATASELAPSKIKCPVCGSSVNEVDLGRAGISSEELTILKRQIKQGTLGTMLRLIDIAMRRIDPDRMNQELVIKEAIAEFTRTVNGLNERILGPALGKVGQMITVRDFKSIATMDSFSEEKASKQGTDIVGTVMENNIPLGKVAISVKYDNSWRGDFFQQLAKNMRQEGTKFGILVTKSFPSEALNNKAYAREDKAGNLMLVAKAEYAAVAYYGFRQAVIAEHEAESVIKDSESQIKEQQRIFKEVKQFVNSQRFQNRLREIEAAINLSNTTDGALERLWTYCHGTIGDIRDQQKDLRTRLANVEAAIWELKKRLKPSKGDGKGPSPNEVERGESYG